MPSVDEVLPGHPPAGTRFDFEQFDPSRSRSYVQPFVDLTRRNGHRGFHRDFRQPRPGQGDSLATRSISGDETARGPGPWRDATDMRSHLASRAVKVNPPILLAEFRGLGGLRFVLRGSRRNLRLEQGQSGLDRVAGDSG